MKNSGKILKRNDGSLLLLLNKQPYPYCPGGYRVVFYIIDENYVRIKNEKGQYRTLVKTFSDAEAIIKECKLIGYQD